MGILIRLGDRLTLSVQDLMHELLDHSELGLALEMMAGALADASAPVSQEERSEMLSLAAEMAMSEPISESLSHCPSRA